MFFFSSRRRHTRCALVTGFRRVLFRSLAAVTAASKLGEVHLLVAGQGVDGVAKAAAQIAGVGKVHVADNVAFGHNLPENIAPLVAELMGSHDARSAERRVGKECVSTCSHRWSPYHKKKTNRKMTV